MGREAVCRTVANAAINETHAAGLHQEREMGICDNLTVAGNLGVGRGITGSYGLLPNYANWAA